MNGRCEYAIGRRYPENWQTHGTEAIACEQRATWSYTRTKDGRTAEFCTSHAKRLGCDQPTMLGAWREKK